MSGLGTRLSRLRRESGKSPPADPSTALRVRIGRARPDHRPRAARPDERELARMLDGHRVVDGLIRVDRLIPAGTLHGRHALGAEMAAALEYLGHPPGDAVFMDTETTGLAGGTGTVVFLLGLGRMVPAGLRVTQLFLTGFKGEPNLLKAAQGLLAGARVLVTYNGKSFDHPLLAARYRLAGLEDPFAPLAHLDLLHPTRGAFSRTWSDCRLQTAEKRLLRFFRSNDLPGSEAPATWFQWVRAGIIERLPAVLEHNHWDVVSLAALLQALPLAFERAPEHAADLGAVARMHGRLGGDKSALDYLLAHERHLAQPDRLELARLAKRHGLTDLAREIWQDLDRAGNPTATEQLAKYYEHTARDPLTAHRLTLRLLQREPANPEYLRRARRLSRRLPESGIGLDMKPAP